MRASLHVFCLITLLSYSFMLARSSEFQVVKSTDLLRASSLSKTVSIGIRTPEEIQHVASVSSKRPISTAWNVSKKQRKRSAQVVQINGRIQGFALDNNRRQKPVWKKGTKKPRTHHKRKSHSLKP